MYLSTFFTSVIMMGATMAQNMVHLDCAIDPDSQCNVDKYCTYTFNNFNCQSQWTDEQVPTFKECALGAGCGDNAVCHDGICCSLTDLPNGEADCPSRDEIMGCCFVRNPGPGGLGTFQPPPQTRPSELNCGC
ncbi:hypothetical protein FALBO_9491 [Fusarium albosuccineum]|uniref:Uncharacterized protein n=1 Tax=Fusarium albosuccineum TaxID=1237068 RepID=A0A8H4L8T8_9HYPO|nr:hypothetical protein FALBO_9491 [Fusarium albosuccineum]